MSLLSTTHYCRKCGAYESRPMPHYLTVLQVARIFQVGTDSVRRWIKAGKLPANKLAGGRDYRIASEDIVFVLEKPE